MTVVSSRRGGRIARVVRGRNLLRLEWIRRRLHATDPTGPGPRLVEELCDAVGAAGAAADPVLADPRFGRWCAELTSLLDRDAPALLPDGRFRAACRDAAALTLAVRIRHNRAPAAVPATTVRIGHDGCVRLPGTGVFLRFDRAHAGTTVRVRADRLDAGPHRPTVHHERSDLPGVVCADGDPIEVAICAGDALLTGGPPTVVIEHGIPEVWRPAPPGICHVPAGAGADTRARYALAAAAQLRAAAGARDLVEPGEGVPDPPPEVADVAWAPQVARLIHLHAMPDPPAAVALTLALIAAWLNAAERLTPTGAEVTRRLAGLGFTGARPAPRPVGPVRPDAWRDAWRAAGGVFRDPPPIVRRFTTALADLRTVLATLGAADGIEVNTLAGGRQRRDPTIDHLSLLKVRRPAGYDAVVARLTTPPRDPAEAVLLGHRAYVEQRFELAVERYADVLIRFPYDVDLWRDFGFALRHLGAPWLGETTMFHLPALVDRALGCELTLPVLEEMRPVAGEWSHMPVPVRVLVGLIEWVADDTDSR